MKNLGKKWRAVGYAPVEDWPSRTRYGLIESETAKVHGYHDPGRSASYLRQKELREERDGRAGPVAMRAARGPDGVSGCWKQANESILEGVPDLGQARFNEWATQTFEQARRSRVVQRAVSDWKGCLESNGVDAEDPLTLLAEFEEQAGAEQPSTREIEVATADVRCKEKVGLVDVWYREEVRLQKKKIDENPAEFEQVLRAKTKWMQNVWDVLESAGVRREGPV